MTRLPTKIVEKPWGKDVLPPQFDVPEGKRIGEVWFVPPPEMPDILVKYIFTSEKLSVQVHPDDAQAKALGESDRGKEECWLVIDAEPGAALGIGFKQEIDSEAMRAAALDGSIEQLMEWFPVQRGDFFYIPAGTVHAIGAGVSLIEIQQNSDITYRLYDYGRPRELHLEQGLQVAKGGPHDTALRLAGAFTKSAILLSTSHFELTHVLGMPDDALLSGCDGFCLVIPVHGACAVAGEKILPGNCAIADSFRAITFEASASALLVHDANR
ncbi:MAG: mannose-6-phosphate isomerase [Sphingomonadales bacterium 17-56-6]|nr:MAG: mannose-6-phosphate isomerase [Sphingomonadales bacterium 17-56-6]